MSEKYLGGIECVRALMAPAKQTINDNSNFFIKFIR